MNIEKGEILDEQPLCHHRIHVWFDAQRVRIEGRDVECIAVLREETTIGVSLYGRVAAIEQAEIDGPPKVN